MMEIFGLLKEWSFSTFDDCNARKELTNMNRDGNRNMNHRNSILSSDIKIKKTQVPGVLLIARSIERDLT